MTKNAIVIGGSNGIGLAIVNNLIKRKYFVDIFDICEPDKTCLNTNSYSYTYCDLNNYDEDFWETVARRTDVNMLIITSGIGRISEFKNFDITEIKKTLSINTVSTVCILRQFYDKLLGSQDFYCGVMASIAGRISSPLGAVYAASKASVVRLIESINIELEKNESINRILEVSPGELKGTRFYGEKNNISLNEQLADEIITKVLNKEQVFIPQYDEIYKKVINRYNKNAREFGLSSYDYKKNSSRINNKSKTIVGYLSGTFDLFHQGHLNLLKRAKKECDYLIVGVHKSGAWKGKDTIVPFEERKEILSSCKYVDKVINSYPEDCDARQEYHYDKLFVGSDYKGSERFKTYEKFFKDKNVKIIYFPYTKNVSSTKRREDINSRKLKK